MKCWTALVLTIVMAASAGIAVAQPASDEQRALRERIEQRYDVVPLTDGLGLRPKSRIRDVRLIEVADGAVSVNGVAVTGRELRDRVGADAEAILRLSYLSPAEQRALFAPPRGAAEGAAIEAPREPQRPPERAEPAVPDARPRRMHASGDRVRIFGDVTVREDEEVTGQAIAVFGSVRIDGTVGDQVVAVFGSVDLGPAAVVRGDIVSVGGRVRRAPGAQTRRGVTEVALSDSDFHVRVWPWFDGSAPFPWYGAFGALPRLIGTGFRFLLLLLLTGIALLVARRSVEASAQRVSDNPVKVTLVGLLAQILVAPVLVLTAVVLAVSIIGIPLLLLIPFVVLALVLLALVGFTGTAAAIGQSVHKRFSPGDAAPFMSVCVGVFVILSPLLLGRMLALAGWPVTPFAFLLVGAGFAVELLAWASGFAAMLTNVFTRWQADRSARRRVTAPPTVS